MNLAISRGAPIQVRPGRSPESTRVGFTRKFADRTTTDDIILGPPKTAFASSRIASKGSIDASDRASRQVEPDEPRNDRFNFRDKSLKDRDPDFDKRPGMLNFRRGDKEDCKDGRPRRTYGPDEQDRKPKRNGEFDRWEGRDHRETRGNERFARDKDGRFPPRKDGHPGRARLEGSWFRDDNADRHDAEGEKPPIRNREWRRDRHAADREWHRGSKFEQEPEWFDSAEPEEPQRAHTQRDFERWKEKMKAGSAQAYGEDKKEPAIERAAGPTQKTESRPTDGEIFSHGGTPFQPDTTMERFFGLLGDRKPAPAASSPTPVDSPTTEKMMGKPGKSSRFAGLFSPPLESHAKELEFQTDAQSPALNASASDADQEGFQRILQMLGGSKSRDATPHNDQSQLPQPSLVQTEQARSSLPHLPTEPVDRPEYMGLQEPPSARSAGFPVQETPLPEDYDKDDPQAGRAQLLRLMQHVRIDPTRNTVPGQGQPQSAGPAPGLMNMPDTLPHPPGIPPGQKGAGFFDDPAIASMPMPETRRPPMGYFDEPPFPHNSQVAITPGGSRVPQGQSNAGMGIQRPPGFEHVPPPGWAGHQLPPRQGGAPGPLPPPPGIPTRGINPNFMSNAMPMHGNMPPLNERQPLPRGAGGNGPAAFGPPPGMMPPPGYMNMNGPPPPGFPPMPHHTEAFMGPGGQVPFGGPPGPQAPPPPSRHLLEVFGQGNGDGRGMPGPGQYR